METQREVELKLAGRLEDLRRIPGHPLVQTLAQGRASTRALDSVYFDTPDGDLVAAGFGLRVRRVDGQRIQTVKGERNAAGGLFDRLEVESPIDADTPDLGRIPDPALASRLREIVRGKPLEPIFRTEFRRTQRLLREGDTEWTLDVDLGEVIAGEKRVPIRELELELRSGEPAQLFQFALQLGEQFDLLPATRSKAERGYALVRGEGAQPVASRRLALRSDATLEQALAAVVGSCFAQISGNAECAFEGVDPEGVHQMRIGVRRLRAAFAAFSSLLPPEQIRIFRSELRWLASELGAARDLDVFTREIAAPIEQERGDDPAFKRLVEEAQALRADCHAQVRETVCSPRYARLILEIGAWLAGRGWRNQPLSEDSARLFAPAHAFARPLLERRLRKARRLGEQIATSQEARHELRIALKKLRYTSQFFRDLYARRSAKRFLRRIARMQNALGRLNDVATAERILEVLLARLGAERQPAHDRAAGYVEGWTAQIARSELHQADEAWERFARVRPFWR